MLGAPRVNSNGVGVSGEATSVLLTRWLLAANVRVTGRGPHCGAAMEPRIVVIGDSGCMAVMVKVLLECLTHHQELSSAVSRGRAV